MLFTESAPRPIQSSSSGDVCVCVIVSVCLSQSINCQKHPNGWSFGCQGYNKVSKFPGTSKLHDWFKN